MPLRLVDGQPLFQPSFFSYHANVSCPNCFKVCLSFLLQIRWRISPNFLLPAMEVQSCRQTQVLPAYFRTSPVMQSWNIYMDRWSGLSSSVEQHPTRPTNVTGVYRHRGEASFEVLLRCHLQGLFCWPDRMWHGFTRYISRTLVAHGNNVVRVPLSYPSNIPGFNMSRMFRCASYPALREHDDEACSKCSKLV